MLVESWVESPSIIFHAILGCIRIFYDFSGLRNDFKYSLAILIWFWVQELYFSNSLGSWSICMIFAASSTIVFASYGIARLLNGNESLPRSQGIKSSEANSSCNLKPLIFPCRTKHTRTFPKKHSFSYSYLFVGIPIGWQHSCQSFLATSLPSSNAQGAKLLPKLGGSKAWFTVEAEDYLDRGSHPLGLAGKLNVYLKSQVSTLISWKIKNWR